MRQFVLVAGLCLFATVLAAAQDCPAITFSGSIVPKNQDDFHLVFMNYDARDLDWVDVHYVVNGGVQLDYRMDVSTLNSKLHYHELPKLPNDEAKLDYGDSIKFWFTYCLDGVDCDTEKTVYTRTPPPPPQPILTQVDKCPGINFAHQLILNEDTANTDDYKILFNKLDDDVELDWVDVHYRKDGVTKNMWINHRMDFNTDSDLSHSINTAEMSLEVGDTVEVFFTYCMGGVDCDSPKFKLQLVPDADEVQEAFVMEDDTMEDAPTEDDSTTEVTGKCPDVIYNAEIAPTATIWYEDNLEDEQSAVYFTALGGKGVKHVDLHITLNDGLQLNYRMIQTADGRFEYELPQELFDIEAGSVLKYFFTFKTLDDKACDTEMFVDMLPEEGFAQAEAGQCPAIDTSDHSITKLGDIWKLTLKLKSVSPAVEWVDLHYKKGEEDYVNLRMTKVDDTTFENSIAASDLPAGSKLSYWFTYLTDGIGCNTEEATWLIPAPNQVHRPSA